MNKINVITHAGMWHADEVLACAMLQIFHGDIQIMRVNEVPVNLPLNEIPDYVIDIGGVYDGKINFDHHQDDSMPASCELIRAYLAWQEPNNIFWNSETLARFSKRVSDIDCNGPEKMKEQPTEFNGMIRRAFNFEEALDLAYTVIQQIQDSVHRIEDSFNKIMLTAKLEDTVLIALDFVPEWRERLPQIMFLITPNERGEGYMVVSRDPEKYPLPKSGSTFIHANRFCAVYPDIDLALATVEMLKKRVDKYNQNPLTQHVNI